VGFVPGAARVRQAAHGAARLERGRGTRRAESRGTGKKKGKEGEGAPTGGARLPERGGAGLCGLGRRWHCWLGRLGLGRGERSGVASWAGRVGLDLAILVCFGFGSSFLYTSLF